MTGEPQAGGNVEVDGGEREFYTLDRGWSLTAGLPVLATPLAGFPQVSSAARAELMRWYPDGLTRHGAQYLFEANGGSVSISSHVELTFEAVRRLDYPAVPSRFQSLFACDDLETAQVFAREYQNGSPGDANVWRVAHAGRRMRADMRLLTCGAQGIDVFTMAAAYWSGHQIDRVRPDLGAQPFWEWLLVPPVRVVERVG